MGSKVYLKTERIFLRELSLEDEKIILDLDSDPDVMKYLTNGKPSSIEEVRNALKSTRHLLEKHDGKFGFWAAYKTDSNEFIGWFHFRPDKNDPENIKRIELGYRFQKHFWGNGYATEGSIALLKKGFSELAVEEVFAITMEKNLKSRKVMEKLGLQLVRSFINPNFPDSEEKDVEYSITKQFWLAHNK